MVVAEPIQPKRIFDHKVIESYCKAKYGYKLVNALGRTEEDQNIKDKDQEEKNPRWLHIYKMLPVGDYRPYWKHKYDILIQSGLLEKELVEFRQNRLDDLLD